jgi:GLPGLI family protein
MRTLSTLLAGLLVLLAQASFAQTEGVITYEVKMNLHRRLPKEREALKNTLPEWNIFKQQLFFNAQESLFKPLEEDEDTDVNVSGGGMRMRMRMPLAETYLHYADAKKLTQTEFMGKKYLIEDSVRIMPWKLTDATKTILGYECKQATYFNEERQQTVVAWYTDKIRPFLGPDTYYSLPGAVLEVDINDGERILKALSINMKALKKNDLKVPASGQKVTQKEYQELMEEQMKKMGNGGMIIRN